MNAVLQRTLTDFLEVTKQTTLPEEAELLRQANQQGPAAKRMRGVELPQQLLMTLNRLEPGVPMVKGQSIKIVTDK